MRPMLFVLSIALAAAVATAQSPVAKRIESISSEGDATALGAKLLEEARSPAAAAASLWLSGNPAVKEKARGVLNEMEEAALQPLLKVAGSLSPQDQAWRMTMTVETLLDLRKTAARMLDQQLANKQVVPAIKSRAGERQEPPRRVCDEAYVQMSALAAANPSADEHLSRMDQFLRMPEPQRDAAIQRARQSPAWRDLRR
jgi:hypothetical protein